MIGLILGTSEGKTILSELNKYTDDIFVSTATTYGGELLKNYKFKVLNTSPLDKNLLIDAFKQNNIKILIDASHPYALEITKNAIDACNQLSIEYLRYERPSILDQFKNEKLVIPIPSYSSLEDKLTNINGNILNTTGSRNINKLLDLNINNRIIHRVLPSTKVMEECFSLGVKVENIIAIKCPLSYELNCAFIKEYNIKALLLKDSGVQGGTDIKLKAAIDSKIPAFVIKRNSINYKKTFFNEKKVVDYIFIKK